jgi:hypothetical protein
VTRLYFEFEIPRNGGHRQRVFGYGTRAGARNELCRATIVSCAFVELCSIQEGIASIWVSEQMCENVLGGAESAPRFVTNGLNKEDWLQQRAKAIRALPGSHSIQFIFCHIGDDETQRGPRKSDKY